MSQKRFNFRQLVWAFLTVIFSITLILSFTTASNYTEIARARILADLSMDFTPVLIYDGAGNLEKVNMTIDFTVNNPSQKTLKIWILNFKAWIRDMPLEDDVDSSRWMIDGEMPVNETVQRYYPIFTASYSFDNPVILVPPGSNITITRYLELDMDVDSAIMGNLIGILNYTAGIGHGIEWYSYSSCIIFINDIPPYSGPNSNTNVIRRSQGFDLTPGIGGVGP